MVGDPSVRQNGSDQLFQQTRRWARPVHGVDPAPPIRWRIERLYLETARNDVDLAVGDVVADGAVRWVMPPIDAGCETRAAASTGSAPSSSTAIGGSHKPAKDGAVVDPLSPANGRPVTTMHAATHRRDTEARADAAAGSPAVAQLLRARNRGEWASFAPGINWECTPWRQAPSGPR